MFEQFFGKYLLEQNHVTAAQLQSILERLEGARVRLGVLAIDAGLMTGEQAESVNRMQRRENLRFGELAVREGFIEESALERLLRKQSKPHLLLSQILVDDGLFTLGEIEALIQDYKRDAGLSEAEVEALRGDDIDGVLASLGHIEQGRLENRGVNNTCAFYVGLFLKNIVRFVSPNIRFDRMRFVDEWRNEGIVYQKLQGGTYDIAYGLTGSVDALIGFARRYMPKLKIPSMDELGWDAVGEFLNVQNGIYLSALSEEGVEPVLTPPEHRESGYVVGDLVFQVPVYLSFGEFHIVISTMPKFCDQDDLGECPSKGPRIAETDRS